MHRLALDIDPFAYVRNLMDEREPDLATAIVLAELGGAESIVGYLRDDLRTCSEKDVNLLRELVKTYLNIRTNITEENIRKLMSIKVDMVTFAAPGDVSAVAPSPLNLTTYGNEVHKYVAELRSTNIISSVLVEPDIEQLKSAGKLEFDYVEIDVSRMSASTDMNEELEFLEELNGLTIAANKIGMGVSISGNIGYDNIKDLAQIANIEDIIVSNAVFNKALSIGLEQAVRDMITLI
ncbi:MAG: hypothetical protein GF313_08915 [Caldithrix sp.]|nr:hypothetical protein [Caldithrix sp.]